MVSLSVYLRAPAETCYDRIKKRNRKEEAGVPFVRSLVIDMSDIFRCTVPVLIEIQSILIVCMSDLMLHSFS